MSNYASGKWANAMCPRCGMKCKHNEMKREWTGQWVCGSCYEEKHPQIDPIKNLYDPQALHHPFPDNDDDKVAAVEAVDFDGSTNYLLRSVPLYGLADGDTGTLSVWVRLDGGNASTLTIFDTGDARFTVSRNSSNKFQIVAKNGAGTTILDIRSTSSYTSGSGWYHILASWNLGTGVSYLYINDTDEETVSTLTEDATIDYTSTSYSVGGTTAGTSLFNGAISQFWFSPLPLTLSTEANRLYFIDTMDAPVTLGGDGSYPFNQSPLIFLPHPASSVAANAGFGGNFIAQGTFADASTAPSD